MKRLKEIEELKQQIKEINQQYDEEKDVFISKRMGSESASIYTLEKQVTI